MNKNYKKVCTASNQIKLLLSLASAATGRVFISAFGSLVGILIGIAVG